MINGSFHLHKGSDPPPPKMKKRIRSDNIKIQEQMLEEMLFGNKQAIESDVLMMNDVSIRREGGRIGDMEDSLEEVQRGDNAVWMDEEEDEIVVDLNSSARLKKLKKSLGGANKVTGRQLTTLLQERFKVGRQQDSIDWTSIMQREADATQEDRLLAMAEPLVGSSDTEGVGLLPNNKLDIARLADANVAESSSDCISAVNFHTSGNLLLAAGHDKVLRFFRVDGDKNEKQLSVRFSDMAILSAQFVPHSSEVLLGGRKPYFYCYDTESGSVRKVSGLAGKNIKSHEKITCSPDGSKIAIMGTGGYAHILDSKAKTSICDVKMNSPLRAQCFLSDTSFLTSGLDAEVYIWDIRKVGRCLARFQHEDGMCTSALDAIYTSSSRGDAYQNYVAVGSESGVVSLYDYTSPVGSRASKPQPTLLKSVMNLTTKATTVKFHPSGQIMAIASNEKTDQIRLVHVPSGRVFNNWPTERTPTRKVECMDFSPGGAYFAIGNNKGKVLLYRLKHFENA